MIADAQIKDHPIVYANHAVAKTTGYETKDFIGKNCRFLQGNDRQQKEISIITNAIKKGEPCSVVLRNYKKDGSLFWNEISLTPIFNTQQKLTHFIGIQNDISSRKKNEFIKNANQHVLDMIIQHEPLESIGNKIIETIEKAIPSCMVSIFLVNKTSNSLHKLVAPNLPSTFSKSIEGISIEKNAASCGTAAFLKKEIIVEDIENIRKIRDEKYATWEWNYGYFPNYDFKQGARTEGGTVEVNMNVAEGKIKNLRITGDFFHIKDISKIEKALENTKHEESEIRKVLSQFDLKNYFEKVTENDLVSIMF